MSRVNFVKSKVTHEGGKAKIITPYQELVRSSLACMLWEKTFYENGDDIANRIAKLAHQVTHKELSTLAIKARNDFKLRHLPLLLTRYLVNHPKIKDNDRSIISYTIYSVINRPDELCEFLAIYWKDGKIPIANQIKKGLAAAFAKFDEYQLAKWNKDTPIKLRDVLFLVHAKPNSVDQEMLWKRLINGELSPPDTWEVGMQKTSDSDKHKVFERLIDENKLPAMATLKNINTMTRWNVGEDYIRRAILNINTKNILPFRFVSAARMAPRYESELEHAMMNCIDSGDKLKGKTILLVDISGSMNSAISGRSDMSRLDAANGLAILAREICEDVVVYTFSNKTVLVPPRKGFALRDAIIKSQPMGGTYLKSAIDYINKNERFDRIITFTDEQSRDGNGTPNCNKAYCINVAPYQNGVAYNSNWLNISGFSEGTLKYIQEYENFITKGD